MTIEDLMPLGKGDFFRICGQSINFSELTVTGFFRENLLNNFFLENFPVRLAVFEIYPLITGAIK